MLDHGTNELLLTFYGDDFTGSTDVLEALTSAGISSMLFIEPPSPGVLSRYKNLQAIGVAGIARSKSPEWMAEELPDVLASLQALGGRLCHYKTCSTFDSSPAIGSIGKALDIGQDVFESDCVPVVVGVPGLRRYVVFGNLFASGGDEIFRIDRHPTMSCHPTTPMAEADLVRHLTAQTKRKIEGFDFVSMLSDQVDVAYKKTSEAAAAVILDTLDEASTYAAGSLLWHEAVNGNRFVVGSSGVEYALIDYLRRSKKLSSAPALAEPGSSSQILVVSGSCSPVTAAQIEYAQTDGFKSIPIDSEVLVDDTRSQEELVSAAVTEFDAGHSLILHTALGPDDPRIARTREALHHQGYRSSDSARVIGDTLGAVARDILSRSNVRRTVFAGGDSTGYMTKALGIEALEMIAPLMPGSPLCRIHGGGNLDGAELVMKGGQVGKSDCFSAVLRGQIEHRFG